MFSRIPLSYYFIGALICALLFFGYMSYSYRGDVSKLEEQLSTVNSQLLASQLALSLKDQSCKVDDALVADFTQERLTLEQRIAELSKQNQALKNKGTKTIVVKENSTNETKDIILDGSEHLSPSLNSLLQQAYCSAEPSGSNCPR